MIPGTDYTEQIPDVLDATCPCGRSLDEYCPYCDEDDDDD